MGVGILGSKGELGMPGPSGPPGPPGPGHYSLRKGTSIIGMPGERGMNGDKVCNVLCIVYKKNGFRISFS